MTQHPDYETLPGGSINYAHYIRKSHEARSKAAHSVLRRLGRAILTLLKAPGRPRAHASDQAPIAAE